MSTPHPLLPLRVVAFNVLPPAFGMVSQWAAQGGHKLVLVVTSPGPVSRRTPTYQGVISSAPPDVDVLVTTRLRTVALPLIRSLQPDLIVSFSFPYRIPPEIYEIPRYRAVNLHPTALPAYRGPNPLRVIYEGYPLLGATLHWTEAEFDTGRVLARHTAPLPAQTSPEAVMGIWPRLMMGALSEGIARAVAGEAGTSQDESQASYGAAFTEAEHWLNPEESQQIIQRKSTALNLFAPAAKLRLGEQVYNVARVDPIESTSTAPAGTLLTQNEQELTLQVADGVVRLQLKP